MIPTSLSYFIDAQKIKDTEEYYVVYNGTEYIVDTWGKQGEITIKNPENNEITCVPLEEISTLGQYVVYLRYDGIRYPASCSLKKKKLYLVHLHPHDLKMTELTDQDVPLITDIEMEFYTSNNYLATLINRYKRFLHISTDQ